jgi:hypothetical protein
MEGLLDDALPSHECDACDECISKFFSWIRLSEIVNVSAVLTNPNSRECVANFYKHSVQYNQSPIRFANNSDWELRRHGIRNLGNGSLKIVSMHWTV